MLYQLNEARIRESVDKCAALLATQRPYVLVTSPMNQVLARMSRYKCNFYGRVSINSYRCSRWTPSIAKNIPERMYQWALDKLYRSAEDRASDIHVIENGMAVSALMMAENKGVPINPFVSREIRKIRKVLEALRQ